MRGLGRWFFFVASFWLVGSSGVYGASPYVRVGPLDELALDQPRVAVELVDLETGRVLGPSLANTFLLDTGANSILAVDDAIYELNRNGYQVDGTFFEQGIGGFTEFDVSAEYKINFAGSDGVVQTIENGRILSSTETSFCPIPGACSFFGIIGMPAMESRVTTLDLSSLGGDGGGAFDIFNIFDVLDSGLSFGALETTFADRVPDTDLRRYHVPIQPGVFPAEGDGPIPSWSDLPFLELMTSHQGTDVKANFVLDTGAQVSLLSSRVAFDLGLDANGNGTLVDEQVSTLPIGGVGGTINAPVLLFDEVRIPTDEGVDLIFNNIQVAIADIDPTIDGIFGMNFLSSGWTNSLLGGFGDLGGLFGDAELLDLLGELGLDLGLEDLGLEDLGVGLGDPDLGLGQGLGLDDLTDYGTASPFGYFDSAHFDFLDWQSGAGSLVLDLMPEVSGILAHDGTHGDLDGDGDLDFDDRQIWVHDVEGTSFGDANLDGVFDSRDIVLVFTAGEYNDGLAMNSVWATGDWDMDGEFTSDDIVAAFRDGGYVASPPAATVPEPSSLVLLSIGLMAIARWRVR